VPPEPIGPADVVVQLAGCHGAEAIREGVRRVADGIGLLGDDLTVVVTCSSDSGGADAGSGRIHVVALAHDPIDRFPVITPAPHDGYRALFSVGRRAGARAMAMIGTSEEQLTPDLVRAVVQPILVDNFDVVSPGYNRQVFDGLLNAGIVYPLTRALYGKRLRGQLGVDFGFSARVAARYGTGADDHPVPRPS